MKFSRFQWWLPIVAAVLAFSFAGCSKLLPPRKGTAHSFQLVLDTRRAPAATLSGCFIPEVFPAISKIPIVFVQPIPPKAVFKTATVEVLAKNGEMKVLEPVIENNQVYLTFAVPEVESFSQYNVLVRVTYEAPR